MMPLAKKQSGLVTVLNLLKEGGGRSAARSVQIGGGGGQVSPAGGGWAWSLAGGVKAREISPRG